MEQVRGLQFERLELNAGTDGAAKPVWFSIDSELGQARESDAAFASGRQPHSSKQERRQYLPSEARREDISVLPLYRISLRRQLNVGLTITLIARESEGCQLNSGRDRNANAGHR